ncbi:S9 family peptidase [Tanticharoenia sakaeratensis]|uniref:Oligopeptidase B n=1 Tax=Tanticharoenia sakaeratensis NBRC 103193 TaxID=1231623 RepID=A0A0D6MHH6_9PROT|nr:S9 family peptidase [Tanticharoenia sakaeratensis]GAN52951.1 oligopeptidase B [Tanticharoenia sakaeratensis NBRC 103193]GBQ19948.1 oligopeptidase B [Tanticharoenia sakaeratensis NBRC 103193]
MTAPTLPQAHRDLKDITQLGRRRTDPYAWMKDENWQKVLRDPAALRPDIAAHLTAENAYADATLEGLADLRKALVGEMVGRIKEVDESLPSPDGAFEYLTRFTAGAQHPIRVRRSRGGGPEETLLDAEARAQGHDYYAVAAARHAPDHSLYAHAEDAQGSEVYRIFVRDLQTGEMLGEPVESTAGSFVFSPDSQWLFWIYRDDNGRPSRIYRRPARGGEDVLVHEEPDQGFFLQISVSASRAFIMIERGDHDTNETLLIPADEPTARPQVAAPMVRGERYGLTHWGDRFVILTNTGGATDFKLCTARPAPGQMPTRDLWVPLVDHLPGHFILDVVALEDHLAWAERCDGNIRILTVARAGLPGEGTDARSVAQAIGEDEAAFALELVPGFEYATTTLRYVYDSPTTPQHWYDLDLATGERTLCKVREIPSGHDPAQYETRRLFATAPDGAQVPITLLMRKKTPADGQAPLLLYGYGSYGIAMDANFNSSVLSLVDRGWIHAVAHVRGGSDKGWGWFLDGRGTKKPNTFTDFVACARHLAAKGYGSEGRIVAHGGSAGGLLMGAVANLAPDLFAGIAAQVPFVDMLNTMSDVSLPLTPPEWPEWGNPIEDPAAYDLIASYSPYDNIRPVAYPPILAMGGLSDPRVTYWEPAKWIARLRAEATGGPFLCRINMGAGHGGSSGRFKRLEEVALVQAFAIWAMERARPGA